MQGNAAVLLLLSAGACGRARRAARRSETGSAQENQSLGAHRPNGPASIRQPLREFLLQIPCRCSKRPPQTQPKATGRWPSFGGEGRLAALDLQTGRLLLARPHLSIDAAAGEEFAMVAALDDAAGFDDEDLVGVDDGRQAMRDGQGRMPRRHLGEARLDLALGLGVERRGRLVENEDLWRLQDDPRDRDALLLAPRQFET